MKRAGPGAALCDRSLAPQPEALDQRPVALYVLPPEVLEQAAALANHLEQATPGVMVLFVGPEVLGQLLDALGQQGDLNLGRAGVGLAPPIIADQRGLLLFEECHWIGTK